MIGLRVGTGGTSGAGYLEGTLSQHYAFREITRDESASRALLDQLRASATKTIVVVTGAGVSAASGVPTFRGRDGLWRNYRAEDLATPEAFAEALVRAVSFSESSNGVPSARELGTVPARIK